MALSASVSEGADVPAWLICGGIVALRSGRGADSWRGGVPEARALKAIAHRGYVKIPHFFVT
ncbi:MAG: hypothetical protein J5641_00860 [Bacteroidales bacterium]|nr:hypothetical protein [Bacteroidales bacterium]